MKSPTIKQQIDAVRECIETNVNSYTHRIGYWKGKIPPSDALDQTNALKAALKTLKKLSNPKHVHFFLRK